MDRGDLGVLGFEGGAQGGDFGFEFGLEFGVELVLLVAQEFAGLVGGGVGAVADFDGFAALLVFLGVHFGVALHLLDFGVAEAGGGLDGDALLFAGALVLGADVEDAVGVDVEGDFDLGHSAGGGEDAVEDELAERVVVGGHVALALEDVDFDLGLVVGGGGEDLAFAGGDGGVAGDQGGADAAEGFDAEGEGGDVEQEDVLDLAAQDAGLDGGAECDDLVGVDAAVGLLAEELLDLLLDEGHAGLAADEHDLVDLVAGDAGVVECGAAGAEGALDQLHHELFELGAGEGVGEMLGAGGVGGDVGEVDFGGLGGGEFDFGVLGGLLEALEGHVVLGEVDGLLLAEDVDEVVHHALVEVVAAEEGVAVGGADLEGAFGEFEDGDVEGAAAEVVDGDVVLVLAFESVGEGGGGGFVDDAEDFEAGDAAGVLGGVALGVVEVGGDGDDGFGDGLAEVGLGVGLQFLEDHGGDFGGGVGAVAELDPGVAVAGFFDGVGEQLLGVGDGGVVEAAAHQALDAEDGLLGVGDGLALGGGADDAFAGFGEGDDGRGGAVAFGVWDDDGFAALHGGDDGVGRAEVDADYSCHSGASSCSSAGSPAAAGSGSWSGSDWGSGSPAPIMTWLARRTRPLLR